MALSLSVCAAAPTDDSVAMGYPRSCEVAVIGAGAAGLVAGRELLREGHKVVVFEKGESVGGTWVYSPSVESDQLGLDPCRKIVHSSLYQSLRVNIPRECMGFFDYPFVPRPSNKERDSRRFPEHREVLLYLQDFAREFELKGLVRFGTEVFDVHLVDEGRWMVRSRKVRMGGCDDAVADESEVFDAIVVCNGHFTEPRIAEIPGSSSSSSFLLLLQRGQFIFSNFVAFAFIEIRVSFKQNRPIYLHRTSKRCLYFMFF